MVCGIIYDDFFKTAARHYLPSGDDSYRLVCTAARPASPVAGLLTIYRPTCKQLIYNSKSRVHDTTVRSVCCYINFVSTQNKSELANRLYSY